MSQVTEQSVRFQTALASIKLIQASAVLDLTEDDFDFLTSNKVWIATDRSRARRCVEAQAGTSAVSDKLLDLVGLGGKSAADKGKDTRDYLAAAFPELNAWERAGADAS